MHRCINIYFPGKTLSISDSLDKHVCKGIICGFYIISFMLAGDNDEDDILNSYIIIEPQDDISMSYHLVQRPFQKYNDNLINIVLDVDYDNIGFYELYRFNNTEECSSFLKGLISILRHFNMELDSVIQICPFDNNINYNVEGLDLELFH